MLRLRALALCGPTASGKSELASRLAQAVGGEIVNADSRQIYAGMRIGSGWPSAEQFARAPHHGYGTIAAGERYSAGRFVADARASIAAIAARGALPILVGGTGLYVEALSGTMPLDRPIADDDLRARVRAEAALHPHEALREWLEAIAPEAAARVEPGDRYRTLRALEEALAAREQRSGRFVDARDDGPVALDLDVVVLEAAPARLATRIAARVDAMFEGGLLEEAAAIRRSYGAAPALTGIGYSEALAYADGAATLAEARNAATRRTRAYAKRQQTWFRRIADAARFDAFDERTPRALLERARGLALPT
ncbi:MAG: tRNA (adenosine(37)-N6)-dimethylallyltransferase MiaA [Candidatus Eremiobacteraeota bacterium]|nr:tRNA (adenosine(37)-N6)-dimethylallyltransferase MiaA [Candidatus Eremiobacteraeota bacterium]MBV8222139.1 tRNA (adenosine(37)-N6)-dimethylallyltransferase MiaA [Candidatus Eremiobacteraeota bacterium]